MPELSTLNRRNQTSANDQLETDETKLQRVINSKQMKCTKGTRLNQNKKDIEGKSQPLEYQRPS